MIRWPDLVFPPVNLWSMPRFESAKRDTSYLRAVKRRSVSAIDSYYRMRKYG